MRRADRLLQIIQILRRHDRPVRAADIAEELEVSHRTIYRDMASLQGSGVPVEGEAGIGYVLGRGYDLPPLIFTLEEIEALVLGARWVAEKGDAALARAADDVLAKTAAVLPADLREEMARTALYVPPSRLEPAPVYMADIRRAIREEKRLEIGYCDAGGQRTGREVWPLALAYFSGATLLAGWCALRQDFRHFRVDRIDGITVTDRKFPNHGGHLLRDYMARMEAECCDRMEGVCGEPHPPRTAPPDETANGAGSLAVIGHLAKRKEAS